jgi:hypothetical protein
MAVAGIAKAGGLADIAVATNLREKMVLADAHLTSLKQKPDEAA